MLKNIIGKFVESLLGVVPISVLVIILSLTQGTMSGGQIGLFVFCAVLMVFGMGLFTLGADVALMKMGTSMGAALSKSKNLVLILFVSFLLGFLITVAEPDLQVLAEQLQHGSGKNLLLLYSVAAGSGIFLVVSILRTYFKINLAYIFLISYAIIFVLAIFVPVEYIGAAFDAGGATTGPITVPFIMALSIGLASVRKGNTSDDSFGMIALCSVGPIIAILILGISGAAPVEVSQVEEHVIHSFMDILRAYGSGIPQNLQEVSIALLPIVGVFVLFQIFVLKLPKQQVFRIIVGIFYAFAGLVLYLTSVNVGFMPLGRELGLSLAGGNLKWILIPLGLLIGFAMVLAEPAVHILNKQVEEITGGAISRRVMLVSISIGVALAVGISMVRVLTGISIWYILLPCYVVAIVLSFFVPKIFTAVAFDSGGVAAGSMAATFMLPFATGAVIAVGGNVVADAFGLVGIVATAPLVTIQLLGLIFKIKTAKKDRELAKLEEEVRVEEEVIDFDDESYYDYEPEADITEPQEETVVEEPQTTEPAAAEKILTETQAETVIEETQEKTFAGEEKPEEIIETQATVEPDQTENETSAEKEKPEENQAEQEEKAKDEETD